jgi:flavodoxin/Pyruvate/2-oxoacid:ferredoxin oxidoreductase delta subunit
MGTELYYFSGTGNSLYVAKELKKRIKGSKLIPIVSSLNKGSIISGTDTVGFFFPVYLTSLPFPVKKFLEKINLKSADYIFAVLTNAGFPGPVDIYLKKIFKKKEKKINSIFKVKMINNSPSGLRPFADKNWTNRIVKEKISMLDADIKKKLDIIQKTVSMKEKNPDEKKFQPLKYLISILMSPALKSLDRSNKEIPFYSDSTCNGCGVCENVCLSKKIKIKNRKPFW